MTSESWDERLAKLGANQYRRDFLEQGKRFFVTGWEVAPKAYVDLMEQLGKPLYKAGYKTSQVALQDAKTMLRDERVVVVDIYDVKLHKLHKRLVKHPSGFIEK